jgi:hypothetical protein
MSDPFCDIPNGDSGRAFREAMRGKQYGWSETMEAWRWFYEGWIRCFECDERRKQ